MQFDYVLFYMAFGALIAFGGLVLAFHAKADHGHGTVSVLGVSISLQAAGGILVVAIGALVFQMPMLMGRDLNNQAEVQRLRSRLAQVVSEKTSISKKLSQTQKLVDEKITVDELNFASIFITYPTLEPIEECAKKIAEKYEVAEKDYVEDGWLVAQYVNGATYIRCSEKIVIVAVSREAEDASSILDAAANEVKSIYPESDPAEDESTNQSSE